MRLESGKEIVKLARRTVEKWFKEKKFEIETTERKEFEVKKGVFVSIHTFPERKLRGCIGFLKSDLSLWEAVQRASYSAAFEDPRFEPLREEELNKIIFEVSILTEPKLIQVKDPKEYLKKIKIGRDGLILQNGPFSGLLLPQVATEFKWSVEDFLENLAFKAGLTPDWIYDKNTRIFKFQAQIFVEEVPNGEIVEAKPSKHF